MSTRVGEMESIQNKTAELVLEERIGPGTLIGKGDGERMEKSKDKKQRRLDESMQRLIERGGIIVENLAVGYYNKFKAILEKLFHCDKYQVTMEHREINAMPMLYPFLIVRNLSDSRTVLIACGSLPSLAGMELHRKNYMVCYLEKVGAVVQQEEPGNQRIACLAFLGTEFGCGWIGDDMIDPGAKWENLALRQSESALSKLVD